MRRRGSRRSRRKPEEKNTSLESLLSMHVVCHVRCAIYDGPSTKISPQGRALQEGPPRTMRSHVQSFIWIDFVKTASWEATGRYIYPDVEKTPGCAETIISLHAQRMLMSIDVALRYYPPHSCLFWIPPHARAGRYKTAIIPAPSAATGFTIPAPPVAAAALPLPEAVLAAPVAFVFVPVVAVLTSLLAVVPALLMAEFAVAKALAAAELPAASALDSALPTAAGERSKISIDVTQMNGGKRGGWTYSSRQQYHPRHW